MNSVEVKLDDETRYTDDTELDIVLDDIASLEMKLDALEGKADALESKADQLAVDHEDIEEKLAGIDSKLVLIEAKLDEDGAALDAIVARWSASPLGMLWPEMDAAFVTSGGNGLAPGMGVEFEHLDGAARQRIDELVRALRAELSR